jgi:hypothetical protein
MPRRRPNIPFAARNGRAGRRVSSRLTRFCVALTGRVSKIATQATHVNPCGYLILDNRDRSGKDAASPIRGGSDNLPPAAFVGNY